jgi:hypothetical protein
MANKIASILTHRTFNYQSKHKLNQGVALVRQTLLRQISKKVPVTIFFLYNGGYRASSLPDQPSLIFEPDQTEWMLLYQIALLNKRISSIYTYGIEFYIVINNGVAKWVNDIPISATESYANKLRKMINFFGAENRVKILLQSELVGFDPGYSFEPFQSQTCLTENEHHIVERFLGRQCSREEAERRSALYSLSETKWSEDVSRIVAAKDGIIMRQVAHPGMLSFRPFPGGAIRIQNGTLGFHFQSNNLRPRLITSTNRKEYTIQWVSYRFPWKENTNIIVKGLDNE